MDDCIFCKIIRGEIPSIKIFEDDQVYVFADINPIQEGHTLVIPKVHAENLFEISDEDLRAVQMTAKKVATAIMETMAPEGVAALQLNGRGAGQVVMHYHLHLVPRSKGAPELPITNWEMKPGDMDRITALGERIAAAIR